MKEKFIRRLPGVFQTPTNKKFFASTIDQLFSSRNSEKLSGFVGRREGGNYDVFNDFYINEHDRARMNYQLEPVAVVQNPDTLENDNEVFYEDLLDRIRFYKGNVSNHDRLFESDQYTFAPPIDIDKYLNYQNYYWVKFDDLEVLPIVINNVIIQGVGDAIESNPSNLVDGSFDFTAIGVSAGQTLVLEGLNLSYTILSVTEDTITLDGNIPFDNNDILNPNEVQSFEYRIETSKLNDLYIETNILGKESYTGRVQTRHFAEAIAGTTATIKIEANKLSDIFSVYNKTKDYYYKETNGHYRFDDVTRELIFDNDVISSAQGSPVVDEGNEIHVTYNEVQFTSNLPVTFPDSESYNDIFRVEGVGRSISLEPKLNQILPMEQYEYLPWDNLAEPWDELTWDVVFKQPDHDYITIERGACDRNGWSRTNNWYHKDALRPIAEFLNVNLLTIGYRAKRPILEFRKDVELYKSGHKWISDVRVASEPLFGDLIGMPASTPVDGVILNTGDLMIFLTRSEAYKLNPWDADGDDEDLLDDTWDSVEWDAYSIGEISGHYIWQVEVTESNTLNFVPYPDELSVVNDGDVVIALEGIKFRGKSFYSIDHDWEEAANQKIKQNHIPVFELYDCQGTALSNEEIYPENDFRGSEIFSYVIDSNSRTNDIELGFPLKFKSLGQISDIVFENDLETSRYTYNVENSSNRAEAKGYYFYKLLNPSNQCEFSPQYETCWRKSSLQSKQRIIDRYVVTNDGEVSFKLSTLPYREEVEDNPDVIIKVDGKNLEASLDFTVENNIVSLSVPLIKGQVFEAFTYSRIFCLEDYKYNGKKKIRLFNNPAYKPQLFVNGIEYNDISYDEQFVTIGNSIPLVPGDHIVFKYFSGENLKSSARGYYEIPSSLEKNPINDEVSQHSYNDFVPHFLSIVRNQEGIASPDLGESNTYRDSLKDLSVGEKILQHESSLLKSMFATSSEEIELISSIRFAAQEYTRFKNKFLKTSKEMIDSNEFAKLYDANNGISKDVWINEILKRIIKTSEVSSTFKNSYMIALGTVFTEEKLIVSENDLDLSDGTSIELESHIVLNDPKSFVYLHKINDNLPLNNSNREEILVVDKDYTLEQTNPEDPITIHLKSHISELLDPSQPYSIVARIYDNSSLPSHIPSTPSKLGMFSVTIPEIVIDYSFTTPANPVGQTFIVGHDGSRTPAFGDLRDTLLLELEIRIYNNIHSKFRSEDFVPSICLDDVLPGRFRDTNYLQEEVNNIIKSSFVKWANTNKVNYLENDYFYGGETLVIGSNGSFTLSTNIFSDSQVVFDNLDIVPGDYLIITDNLTDQTELEVFSIQSVSGTQITVDSNFSYNGSNVSYKIRSKGDEWTYNYRGYGTDVENIPGYWRGMYRFYYDTETPHTTPWKMLGFTNKPSWWENEYGSWPYLPSNDMWQDLENGVIRQGARAGTHSAYARKGLLLNFLPVNEYGFLKSPREIGLVSEVQNINDAKRSWKFGDGAPAENAWLNTSHYPFAVVELLYLTKPARFSDYFWDTIDLTTTEINPSQVVSSSVCKRRGNDELVVHGESINGNIQVKYGYQQYISDRLSMLGLSIKTSFADKLRSLNVKLGHKVGGFTNTLTNKIYFESASPLSVSTNNIIPVENISTKITTGPSIKEYSYSGVIIRAHENGSYQIFGYDLINPLFKSRKAQAKSRAYEVSVAGKSAPFRIFEIGQTYRQHEIVKYNSVFYRCANEHEADRFYNEYWKKLTNLPTAGGVKVTHYPDRSDIIEEYEYGHIFNTEQEVFDFLIGYGEYLEKEGWIFDQIETDTGIIRNFYESGRQFLFWVATGWGVDNVITVSPLAQKPKLYVDHGYPMSVERTTNGVYSILDEHGVLIDPRLTTINREDKIIEVLPKDPQVKIYSFRVNASETEHTIVFDNVTEFNDVIYNPLFSSRQNRLKFNGTRTLGWYGKYEAPGYIITQDQNILANVENTTASMELYHDTTTALDNSAAEDVARHLIGFEEKSFLIDLELAEDSQFQFYQGMIREKGTQESISKLLRSIYVRKDQNINVFEEWALKVAEYGGTCENSRFDVLIRPDEVKTEPQLIVFDTPESATGYVKEIIVTNAEAIWETPPQITITTHPSDKGDPEPATAISVLNKDGTLKEIIVDNPGSGYSYPPLVYIGESYWDGSEWDLYAWDVGTNDKAIAILQKEITEDPTNDDLIVIDIDDNERWISRVRDCDLRDFWPTTANISYDMPSAGYVHPRDVYFKVFDSEKISDLWLPTTPRQPTERDDIWVAKNQSEDWAVYRIIDIDTQFILDQEDGLQIKLLNELPTFENDKRVLQGWLILDDVNFGTENEIQETLFRYEYVGYYETSVPSELNENEVEYRHVYSLTDHEGNVPNIQVDQTIGDDIWLFVNMRFANEQDLSNFMDLSHDFNCFKPNEKVWIDSDNQGKWVVKEFRDNGIQVPWDTTMWECHPWDSGAISNQIVIRRQDRLVDTHKFKQAFLYENESGKTITMLPVYDPFKGLIPGFAEQNIDFKASNDPARYTVASDQGLVNPSKVFGRKQVGKLWWDTSNVRYYYYEQGTIRDRRDFWGTVFPGSSIDIYEWTRSVNPPTSYTGDGVVRNTTDYVQSYEYDPLSGRNITVYYFWVKDVITVPSGIKNRTISASEVSRVILNPRTQNYQWFSPVSYLNNSNDNALVINNVNRNISNQESVLQVNFKHTEKDIPVHTEWHLMRQGDEFSLPLPSHWNKLVDSIVGMTKEINWGNTPELHGFCPTTIGKGFLIVPDPSLSEDEKYGINFRPRQTWFKNLADARKVFVRKANELLKEISLEDLRSNWADDLPSNNGFAFYRLHNRINWYLKGWDVATAVASRQVNTTGELASIEDLLIDGEIVKVVNGYRDSEGQFKYVLYQYDIHTKTFTTIAKQDATIEIDETRVLTASNIGAIRKEFRALIDSLKNKIFIEDLKINQNLLFFTMLNYALSEHKNLDWAFKTTYILINQTGLELTQQKSYQRDTLPSTLEYINTAKPYHTKVRDYTISRNAGLEIASGTASELREMIVKIRYARVGCSGWDVFAWDSKPWQHEFYDVPSWGCPASYIIRDASSFIAPTYPWDATLWDELGWDANSPVVYLSATDESNASFFDEIEPSQTVEYDGINLIILNFSPAFESEGPMVFVGKRYTRNFEYQNKSYNIKGEGSTSVEIGGLKEFNGIIDVKVDNVAQTQVGANPSINEYSVSYNSDGNAVLTFASAISSSSVVEVSYKAIRLYEYNIIPHGAEIEIYNMLSADAGTFMQPMWKEGIPEELIPVTAHENMVIRVDTNPYFRFDTYEAVIDSDYVYLLHNPDVIESTMTVFINDVVYEDFIFVDSENPGFTLPVGNELLLGDIVKVCYRVKNTCDSMNSYTYLLHFDPHGYQRMYRNASMYSAKLAESIVATSTVIEIIDEGDIGLESNPSVNNPGIVWIGTERIEFAARHENTLYSLRRGTHGTLPQDHVAGTHIFDAGDNNLVPDIRYGNPLGDLSEDVLDFMYQGPNTGSLGSPCSSIEIPEDFHLLTEDGSILMTEDCQYLDVEFIALLAENGDFLITEDDKLLIYELVKPDCLLAENGDFLITEDDKFLIYEFIALLSEDGDILTDENGQIIIYQSSGNESDELDTEEPYDPLCSGSYYDQIMSQNPTHYWRFTDDTLYDVGGPHLNPLVNDEIGSNLALGINVEIHPNSGLGGIAVVGKDQTSEPEFGIQSGFVLQTPIVIEEGSAFSMEAWIKVDPNIGFFGAILGDFHWQGPELLSEGANIVLSWINNNGEFFIHSQVNTGHWMHAVLVREEDGTLTGYLNNTSGVTEGSITDSASFGFIANDGDNEGFIGKMSEVVFYDRALTPEEVEANYLQGRNCLDTGE